jgi:hypothetical protein
MLIQDISAVLLSSLLAVWSLIFTSKSYPLNKNNDKTDDKTNESQGTFGASNVFSIDTCFALNSINEPTVISIRTDKEVATILDDSIPV